jgi:malate dehydrogenase (oxaloacetate-decarboxylating)(NADP+)
LRNLTVKAQSNPKKVVFAEADNYKILKAAQFAIEEGIAIPILLGKRKKIEALIEEYSLRFSDFDIIDPKSEEEEARRIKYGKAYLKNANGKDLQNLNPFKLCANEIILVQ